MLPIALRWLDGGSVVQRKGDDMATRWKRGFYKGHPLFEVYGERDTTKPLISFGLVKAKAILEQVGALRAWVAEMDEPEPEMARGVPGSEEERA